ncbi:elongation factor G [candidate division KSB3 bacterium]|uniref:Elongation factor G n=1 Tax=candidate division KSB3 bacterium TaxID=2044937 RepID=A0A2G6E280_9BACT|nr:MAG: elongation factor G [candidate division KSB3 bacterium]PIE28718.1 MAG: elongation factor G [candidate division KSB3 bacterium]
MKKYDSAQIRNVGIVGHGNVGKTSLAEAFLFNAKMIERLGKVDDGNTTTDYDEDEKKRQITINSTVAYCEWNKHKINLIDTPGFADFMTDTKVSLSVVDIALLMVCGVSGVEVLTSRTWNFADEFKLPKFLFINKLDRERASFERTMDSLRETFGDSVIPVQLPVGQESSFRGVVDLVSQKAYLYDNASGSVRESAIPDDMADAAAEARDSLIEKAAEGKDELIEKYLEEGELSDEEIVEGLKAGLLSGTVCPVFCGSALKNIAAKQVLDAIVSWAPSPLEHEAVAGKRVDSDEEVICSHDSDAPVLARVFKTFIDPFAGRVNLFRVYSGTLTADSQLYNLNKEIKERVAHIVCVMGKKHSEVNALNLGDIGAVLKLTETGTNDTLSEEKQGIILPAVPIPQPIISFSIKPKSRGDEDKIGLGLSRLMEEDVTLVYKRDERTKEFVISGMGQLHVEIIVDKLKSQFGVDVVLAPPKVPYLETIKGTAEVRGRHKKQSGGRGQFGDCWIKMEPLPRGGQFEFVNAIVGGAIPKQYIPAVEKGIVKAMENGVLAGYPTVDVKITVYDGSYHPVDSSEMAFQIAGSLAFKEAVPKCKPTLLEPVMKMEVVVPEECMGDIMGDINGRRGRVLGMDGQGNLQIIRALVPMAEILKYAPALKSMTGGRGSYTMEFDSYEEVPGQFQEKIIEDAKKAAEEEE